MCSSDLAFNDVLAWCLLAWIVAISRSAEASAMRPLLILVVYVAIMFGVVRPALRGLADKLAGSELSAMLIFLFLSSWVTELAGFHALFGAFLAGAVWPRGSNNGKIAADIEPLATKMLIPLFFSYTGLRTNIGAVGDHIGLSALVIAGAIAGKVGGAFAGARLTGFDTRNSLALGFLLNTRGLVELIVLNVGLEQGILSLPLYSMMILMALVTTGMTTPLLKLVRPGVSHG